MSLLDGAACGLDRPLWLLNVKPMALQAQDLWDVERARERMESIRPLLFSHTPTTHPNADYIA